MVAGVSAMRCETVALKFDHDSITRSTRQIPLYDSSHCSIHKFHRISVHSSTYVHVLNTQIKL